MQELLYDFCGEEIRKMGKIDIKEIGVENKEFWNSFFAVSYPNGYDEDMDLSVEEFVTNMAEQKLPNIAGGNQDAGNI